MRSSPGGGGGIILGHPEFEVGKQRETQQGKRAPHADLGLPVGRPKLSVGEARNPHSGGESGRVCPPSGLHSWRPCVNTRMN